MSGVVVARLPQTDWTQRADLAQLVAALGAEDMRWVGGAVRDTLLGTEVNDIDAATTLHPPEVIERLEDVGIKPIPTGLAHGTVTAVLPAGNVEITTLRKDVATDGRRATVAFAEEWQDDAARRDFTINALYAHPETLEISDYFGGLADLDARRVRFIGDARERIREDHLRILRYYRFQSRFGAELDAEAEEACAELASTLKGLSRERVAMELFYLLGTPRVISTLQRMLEKGVLPVVLPETGLSEIATLERLLETQRKTNFGWSSTRSLAALLPPDVTVREQVAARLRLSTPQRKRLVRLAELKNVQVETDAAARVLLYAEGMRITADHLLISGANPNFLRNLRKWDVPTFPLKGGAIVARGVGAGPEVARILQAVERRWIAEGFPDAARVEELLDEMLGK